MPQCTGQLLHDEYSSLFPGQSVGILLFISRRSGLQSNTQRYGKIYGSDEAVGFRVHVQSRPWSSELAESVTITYPRKKAQAVN